MASSNGFIYALQESHLPGIIICVTLVLLSAFSWTVMITKFLMIHRARRQTTEFLDLFRRAESPLDPYATRAIYEGSPIFWVYRSGCRELTFQMLGSSEIDDTMRSRIRRAGSVDNSQLAVVTNSMERTVGEVALRLENQMTLLATAVSGAPFLGLLGTVWGVMETFSGVASAGGGASLQSMAPGVSAALVTTVIALLVAIPAMFGYNFLLNSIRATIVRMDNFAAELSAAFDRGYCNIPRREENLPSLTELGAGRPSAGPPRPKSPGPQSAAPSAFTTAETAVVAKPPRDADMVVRTRPVSQVPPPAGEANDKTKGEASTIAGDPLDAPEPDKIPFTARSQYGPQKPANPFTETGEPREHVAPPKSPVSPPPTDGEPGLPALAKLRALVAAAQPHLPATSSTPAPPSAGPPPENGS